MTNQLSYCKKAPVATIEGLITEMEKIQRIKRKDGSVRLTTFTRKQKEILELFNIDINDYINEPVKN